MSAANVPKNGSAAIRVGIIVGSTRPGRKSEAVARWVYEIANRRNDAHFEIVDLKDYPLPLLDDPGLPSMGMPHPAHAKSWADTVASFDAYVFVTPEYNHAPSGVLKNAIDYLYPEWNNKAAGFVSYGSAGGVRAVEHLRLIMAELQVATVRAQVFLPLTTEFENYTVFKPTAAKEQALTTMLDQIVAWGRALRSVRFPEGVRSEGTLPVHQGKPLGRVARAHG